MKAEDQARFDNELKLVIAVAAQLYETRTGVRDTVSAAIELIRESESRLKEHYDQKSNQPQSPVSPAVQSGPSRETINRLISESADILFKKGVCTKDELFGMLRQYGATCKEDLTDTQATDFYNHLKGRLG